MFLFCAWKLSLKFCFFIFLLRVHLLMWLNIFFMFSMSWWSICGFIAVLWSVILSFWQIWTINLQHKKWSFNATIKSIWTEKKTVESEQTGYTPLFNYRTDKQNSDSGQKLWMATDIVIGMQTVADLFPLQFCPRSPCPS